MKRSFRVLPLLLFAMLSALPARVQAQTQSQLQVVVAAYTNQSNSTLYIESVAGNGLVTGYYINRAPGYGCQNTAYPVTGWLFGTAFSFTVIWKNSAQSCNSVTGWTGYFSSDYSTLTTSWNLAANNSTQILAGTDVFRRVAFQQHRSLTEP